MTFRRYKDGYGNEILSLQGINYSRDAESGEDAASHRRMDASINSRVAESGGFTRGGVEFTPNGEGGYSMRLAGQRLSEVLMSEENAKPKESK